MRTRWLAALGLGLLTGGPAAAQVVAPPAPLDPIYEPVSADPDRPTELPPLLPIPQGTPTAPRPGGSTCPPCDYDPAYQYLPDRAPACPKLPPCPCRPLGQYWVIPALELGWSRPADVPPLLRVGVPDGRGGFLPGPVVFGDQRVSAGFRPGFSITAGTWLDRCQTNGIDGSFFFLGTGTTDTTTFAPGVPLVLQTSNLGPQALFALSSLAAGIGSHEAIYETRFFTFDANYRRNLYCETNTRIDGLLGYRYAGVHEQLDLYGRRAGPTGEIVRFRDTASAANHFHGGQIGVAAEHRVGDWYFGLTGKLALGAVVTDTDLEGAFRVNGVVMPNGFYARPAVSGPRSHTDFAVMPVVNLSVGRQLGEHARVFAGYTFQYLSRVTRAGDVIDPVPDLLGTGAGMSRDGSRSSYWAQTLNVGMEWRF
jgi:hypothetical protein